MPAKPTWLLRLPQILEDLRATPIPFVDRDTVEKLFRLRRRRAIELMGNFGGYQIGRTFLIHKAELVGALERVVAGEEFAWESRRKARVAQAVEHAQREHAAREVRIDADHNVMNRRLPDLPAAVQLGPGELRIEFEGAEELLRNLLELSQAIMNDFPRFQSLVERNPPTLPL